MTLICFKNGSLAREAVRKSHGLDWDGFSHALQSTPPGNHGKIMLPYFEPEIVPKCPQSRRTPLLTLDEQDAAGNCRAVVEAQMMSMRLHSEWMGVRPSAIYVTGVVHRSTPKFSRLWPTYKTVPFINLKSPTARLSAPHSAPHRHTSTPPGKRSAEVSPNPISGSAVTPNQHRSVRRTWSKNMPNANKIALNK